MHIHALGLGAAALCIAATLSAPATASDPKFIPSPYLQPEFPNYLTWPYRAADCAWYDYCWYVLVRPLEFAPEPVPVVKRGRVRARS